MRASDDFDSLDQQVARRIVEGVKRYAKLRIGDVIKLQGGGGVLRLRIGNWRVLFENIQGGEIRILRVLHRSQAYR